jgi:hypothetical protein
MAEHDILDLWSLHGCAESRLGHDRVACVSITITPSPMTIPVSVAFGGVGVRVLAQFVEADLFFLQVGLRCEFLFHDAHSKLSRIEDSVLLREDVGPRIRRHLNVR